MVRRLFAVSATVQGRVCPDMGYVRIFGPSRCGNLSGPRAHLQPDCGEAGGMCLHSRRVRGVNFDVDMSFAGSDGTFLKRRAGPCEADTHHRREHGPSRLSCEWRLQGNPGYATAKGFADQPEMEERAVIQLELTAGPSRMSLCAE